LNWIGSYLRIVLAEECLFFVFEFVMDVRKDVRIKHVRKLVSIIPD
jgi:hypothetical protein